MPAQVKVYKKKKNYKKKYYKKKYFKKRYNKSRYTFVNLPGVGLPEKMRMNIVVTNQSFVSTGTMTIKSYCLNSLYDPYQSIFANQPAYYDAFTLLYSRFQVNSCKVSMTFVNESSAENVNICIYYDTQQSATTVLQKARQTKNNSFHIIGVSANSNSTQYHTYNVNPKGLHGYTGKSDLDFSHPVGSDPVKRVFQHMLISNSDASTAIQLRVYSKMVFNISMFDHVQVTDES